MPKLLLVLLLCPLTLTAMPSDTLQRHELREVEVLGLKQMPDAGVLPVTEISRHQVNAWRVDAVKDIGNVAPNLYTPSYGSRMTSSIYMRGLGSRMENAVVGLNVDGVPVMNKDSYDFDLPDIRMVEVLRGSQSVLNGRNSMAGQINIFTLSPLTTRGLRCMAEYGRGNSEKFAAAYYFGISQRVSMGISAFQQHTDGFFRNSYNNSRVGRENNFSARWKTAIKLSRAHTVTNTASLSLSRQNGYPYQQIGFPAVSYNDTCFYRRTAFTDGLTVAWAGKRVVVNSITSFQYLSDNMTLDQDFTPLEYFTLTQRRHEYALTEDLFTKGTRGSYSWLGGVFGAYRHNNMDAPVTFFEDGISDLIEQKRNQINPEYPIRWDSRQFLLGSNFRNSNSEIALYHQSSLKIGDWLFEGGLRWQMEHVTCDYLSQADASYTTYQLDGQGRWEPRSNTPINIHDQGKLSQTFNQVLPKVVISRKIGKTSAFISFSKGYKSGGYNVQMFSDVLQQRVMQTMGLSMLYDIDTMIKYKPEWSWNYELGVNYEDSHLKGNLTAFWIDCRDQQLTMFPAGTVTGRIMTNAGRTRSLGLEASLQAQITENLTANIAYGLTNATFRKYNDGKNDYRGKHVPYAPQNTLFTALQWNLPWQLAGLSISSDINLRCNGKIFWNEANTASQPFYAVPSFSVNLSRSIWSLRIWTENFTNTHYNTFYFKSMGREFVQKSDPLTFGATIRLHINKY